MTNVSPSTNPTPRDVSRALLLRLIRPNPGGMPEWWPDRVADVDWMWLLDRAVAHKVAALFTARLDATGVVLALPLPVQQRLDEIRQHADGRTAKAQRTLHLVAEAMASRGVPLLAVKGSVLAERVYLNPRLRPFFDVDIVVPEAHLGPAEDALRSVGYRFNSATVKQLMWEGASVEGRLNARVSDEQARDVFRRVHQHFEFVPEDKQLLHVELHWRLRRHWLMRLDASALWEHTRPARVADSDVLVLTPEVMLLYAASHAMSDGPHLFRLLHLNDVAWILERHGRELDARRLWRLAAQWGVRGDFGCALQALHEVLDVDAGGLLGYRRHHGPLARAMFRAAATMRRLVDQEWSSREIGRLADGAVATALWELATRRPPRLAARKASNSIRVGWRGVTERKA